MSKQLLQTVKQDITDFLAQNHLLFNNEAELQVNLATFLNLSNHYDEVRLEYNIPNTQILPNYIWNKELKTDIVVIKDGEYLPIKLKYKTKLINMPSIRYGQLVSNTTLKNQGAQDLGQYDFWRDVRRIEILQNYFSCVDNGLVLFVTNDKKYLKPTNKNTNKNPNNYHFSMEGQVQHSTCKHWLRTTSGTKGRPNFNLSNSYFINWNQLIINNNDFYYCLIEI